MAFFFLLRRRKRRNKGIMLQNHQIMVSSWCQWYTQVVSYVSSCLFKQASNSGRGICTGRQVIILRTMTHTVRLSLFLWDFWTIFYSVLYSDIGQPLTIKKKTMYNQHCFCTDMAHFQQALERFMHWNMRTCWETDEDTAEDLIRGTIYTQICLLSVMYVRYVIPPDMYVEAFI